ncbi:hypothetical protein [Dokdonella sp.]|uniref:hypothetical protein n=1 Tax=Dokdonella sp. TaxID=2291710 RepID=UPI003784A50A
MHHPPRLRLLAPICLSLLAVAPAFGGEAPSIDVEEARAAIAQAERLCRLDDGHLWGVSLCGPLLLADPATHRVVASAADAHGELRAEHGVYVGRLPDAVQVANTALDWNGVQWVALSWPLPREPEARARLLMHESWHRIQGALGLPQASPTPAHLDSLDGRIRMRLEWRALAAALSPRGKALRQQAIADALTIRAWRRQLGGTAAADERALELNEGLAEYTGYRLAGADAYARVRADLRAAEQGASFVRSFAYHSGPALGLLLDEADAHWRSRLAASTDLGTLLGEAESIVMPADLEAAAQKVLARYSGGDLRAQEQARDRAQRALRAQWQAKLVDGPVLLLPFSDMHIGFDPRNLVALPPHGTVYPTLRISDRWGTLSVVDGALIDDNWSGVQVPAPAHGGASAHPQGDGWQLDLAHGWTLVPSAKSGDYTLRMEKDP